MTQKAAYLWGPLSSFSAPLAALLLQKGWQVHVSTKSALNLFTLAPLDLSSTAQCALERALGGHEQLKTFQDRFRLLEGAEPVKGTTYDVVIFCGLPPNFDEARAPRAPWAAAELLAVAKMLKGVPIFIVSSLWGGIQPDGVVPEELEFERRKPQSHWEGVCQQYETRVLKDLASCESPSHLIRLPLVSGAGSDGKAFNFSGLLTMLRELSEKQAAKPGGEQEGVLKLNYNPDATLWFLPVDTAVHLFWRILEDGQRPRICNLVSTETTLNREWLYSAARALGYEQVEAVDSDNFGLPGILKKMLSDNILVKTRNLFEVAGRYHISPTKLDQAYFEQLLSAARADNWGRPVTAEPAPAEMTEGLACEYFERFLPAHLGAPYLKSLTGGDTTITFHVDFAIGSQQGGAATGSWQLKSIEGHAAVERVDPEPKASGIRLQAESTVIMSLVTGKTSLQKALLWRECRLEGPPLHLLRFAGAFAKFVKNNPFDPQAVKMSEPSVPAGAAT